MTTNEQEIENILDIISYGVEWTDTCEDNHDYKAGSFETVGYIVSCFLCKRLGMNGCATCDAVEFLKLEEHMSRDKRKKLVKKLLES